jgi:hypothetical protein
LPSTSVKKSSSQGVTQPEKAHQVSRPPATRERICAASICGRLPKRSAIVPATSARNSTGREAAVWTSATIVGDEDRLIISQAAAICWTIVPKLEMSVAVQIAAKMG